MDLNFKPLMYQKMIEEIGNKYGDDYNGVNDNIDEYCDKHINITNMREFKKEYCAYGTCCPSCIMDTMINILVCFKLHEPQLLTLITTNKWKQFLNFLDSEGLEGCDEEYTCIDKFLNSEYFDK